MMYNIMRLMLLHFYYSTPVLPIFSLFSPMTVHDKNARVRYANRYNVFFILVFNELTWYVIFVHYLHQ